MKCRWWMILGLVGIFQPMVLGEPPVDELLKKGRALVCDREFGDAGNTFDLALASAPENLEAAIGRIDAFGYTRKISDAESFVKTQFASSPEKAKITGAYLKIWKRDYDGAAADLNGVTPAQGDAYLVAYLKGYIQFIKKNWDGAIPHLEESLTLNPVYSQAYFLLGDVFRIKDDAEKVTEYWGQYLEMVPKGNACAQYVNDYLLKIGGR